MRYRVLVSHGLGGGKFAQEGDVLELDGEVAEEKVRRGYVVPEPDAPAAEPAAAAEPTAEPEAEPAAEPAADDQEARPRKKK